jgi:carbonic anhydrase
MKLTAKSRVAVAAAQADGSHQQHDDNHPAHHIAHLVAKILPAVRSAMEVVSTEAGEVDKERLLDVAISENVLATQHEILSRSSILRAFAADKKLAVRSGVYCLSTGVVSLINQ